MHQMRTTHEIPEYTVPIRRSSSMSGINRLRKPVTVDQHFAIPNESVALITYPFTPIEKKSLLYSQDDELSFMDVYDSLEREIQDANDARFM